MTKRVFLLVAAPAYVVLGLIAGVIIGCQMWWREWHDDDVYCTPQRDWWRE